MIYRKGGGQSPTTVLDAILRDGSAFADAHALSAATGIPTTATGEVPVRAFVGDRFTVSWNAETSRATLAERDL